MRRLKMADCFSVHLYSFTASTLHALLERCGYVNATFVNSPVTRGDPAARLSGARLRILDGAKRIVFYAAECARLASLNRLHLAPSLVAFANRPRSLR